MSEPTTPIEGKFADYLTIEASIANDPDAAITAFSPNALPGLLHTAEYRRSLLQLVTGQTHKRRQAEY